MEIVVHRGLVYLDLTVKFYYKVLNENNGEFYTVSGWLRGIVGQKPMIRFNVAERFTNPVSAILFACEAAGKELNRIYADASK